MCVCIRWYLMIYSADFNERNHFFLSCLHSWGQYFIFVKINFFVFYNDFSILKIIIFDFSFFRTNIVYILWIYSMQDKILYNLKKKVDSL